MFRPKTLLIIGAGASVEANLPVGSDLKEQIAQLARYRVEHGSVVSGDQQFLYQLQHELKIPIQQAIKACAKISVGIGFVSSVDNFLEIHAGNPDVQKCAKAAIAYLIAKGERSSRLYVDPSNMYNRLSAANLKDTWYQELAHILFEKVDNSSITNAFTSVRFVSFNYDRCLEWFLFQALTGLYAIDRSQAIELLTQVDILHPYGDIGSPSWRGGSSEFFGPNDRQYLPSMADRLLTYTENSTPEVITKIRTEVAAASTIVFLGFAFHPQNIEILRPQSEGKISKVQNIFGTSYKMSENDIHEVSDQLSRAFTLAPDGSLGGRAIVKLADLSCCEFLRRYKRTLAA